MTALDKPFCEKMKKGQEPDDRQVDVLPVGASNKLIKKGIKGILGNTLNMSQ
jgi:hypothetical protein